MPRKTHPIHSEFPYHVSARSHGGDWFRIRPEQAWKVMSDYLYFISLVYEVKIHAFVLMSNHFHLLVSTPKANLSEAMNYFMRETSKEINRVSGHCNQVYGGRFYRTLITSPFYLDHAYKYVYRNPVKAGLVQKCEEYRFSTLHGLLGQSRLSIPVIEDHRIFGQGLLENTLQWINTKPTEINDEAMGRALKRKNFKFARGRNSGGNTLETDRY
jgi:putative transposase